MKAASFERHTESPPKAAERPRYVLVTPVYNEEKFIGRMIESIAAQTILPEHWIIVDDGSTDKSPAIVQNLAQRYAFIELIRLPRQDVRKPGGESVIQQAIVLAQAYPHDFLARFDADIEFPPDYIERIFDEFSLDPTLGIAGGSLYVEKEGSLELEKVPAYHVRGALKMYRKQCLQQIGSLQTHMGWDTIDEIYAWMHGWRTRSFMGNRAIHKRPTGEGLSPREIAWQRGRGEYYTWSHPLFVAAKTMRLAFTGPAAALSYLSGFLAGYWRGSERAQDPLFKRIRRSQQLRRLLSLGLISEPKV